MKIRAVFLFMAFLVFFLTKIASAQDEVTQAETLDQATVDKIARLAYEQPRGADSHLHAKMLIVSSSKMKQNRELDIFRQDWNGRYRNLVKFTKPNDIKGTGFLTWSYPRKDDVQWLYLPALGKVRKISLKSKHNSFVGTDFSYDDMRERKVEEDSFSFVAMKKLLGQDCYVLRATPTKDSRSEYDNMELYIRKDNNYLVGVRYFKRGKLYKLFLARKLKKIDGIWISHRMEMKNIQKRSKTILDVTETHINSGLKDDKFTERSLSR
ncbi:outer membrane lipoprotein-sorting protein [Candidatus Riflebacteria bacterium]